MVKNTEVTAFDTFDRLHIVRTELDGKIDKKVSHQVFFGVLGLLVLICGGVLGFAIAQIGEENKNIIGLRDRMTVLETKSSLHNNQ